MSACCVSGCKNRHSSTSKLKFYRIPSGYRPFQANRRRLWLQAIQQVNGKTDELKGNVRICGAHFVSGEASMDHDSPDFVPSVFTCTKPSPKKKAKRFYGHRRRRRHKANAEKKEKTTPPRVDSAVDVQSPVSMETESELSEEIQTPSTPSVPKEGETLTEKAEAESGTKAIQSQTTASPNKTSQSFKVPVGISRLDKMNPVVLLKPLVVPAGGYRCELCNQNFTSVSQLVKHKQLHEEGRSFICEICGKRFTSQADFNEHQHDHTDEPSFPCNMCDRSFTTNHNLKRHKLLHVRDGRKCGRCGVLFCRRHNHFLFLPQPESVTESEQDSSLNELKSAGSNLMPEKGLRKNAEPSQTDDLDDNAQSTMTLKPILTTTPTPQNRGPLSKTHKAPPPASHKRIPVPVLPIPSSVPCSAPSVPSCSRNPDTSSQLRPPLPDYPATFIQPHLSQHPELPSSLKIFSPQFLTSALLEVERNYEYILSKPRDVQKDIVKEEECELPLSSPDEQSVEQVKKQRTAYDLEIVV
ncbi:zinc finger and SCAN domain-containing protein 5B-like [Xiphias gladius]|uniref:zinc finger and SCAN domain-containing protein 5B-like n=1 Tax=Xiphias gladius TaxID=8245 RepID=UPI001A994AD1|nr:zinc finger and SCAN domain-containing protein 5B-like [Xiphias gladius]